MKIKVPSAIKIGDRWIKIFYPLEIVDTDGTESYGETLVDELTIRISKTACKSETDILDTIFHELCHVALHITGHSNTLGEAQEEALVYALQFTLARAFKLNPKQGIKYAVIEFPW